MQVKQVLAQRAQKEKEMGTKNNPGKFDCYSRAEPDEPMFVLLGRDPSASLLIGLWAMLREDVGEDPEKVEEARTCADACLDWAAKHGKSHRALEVDQKWREYLKTHREELSDRAVTMIKGLMRYAELREADESKGVIWDDESREALALAREHGWGKDRTGRLP